MACAPQEHLDGDLEDTRVQKDTAAGIRRFAMFHKIKNISALPDFKLSVQFSEGVTKIYDVKPLFEQISVFKEFETISKTDFFM